MFYLRRIFMIYRRHLLIFGPKGSYLHSNDNEDSSKKNLSMGQDEEQEVLPEETLSLRTWWRKWLKVK
jgi:hypothetical protein